MYSFKCSVHTFSSSFGLSVDERTRISCIALSVRFTYLAACLALQWMKKRGISCMRVKCRVHIFSGSFGSIVDERTRNKLYAC